MARIDDQVMAVKRGVRSVAEVMINNEDLGDARDRLVCAEVEWLENPRGETHTGIYVFKHPHLRRIIQCILSEEYGVDGFQAWLHGKLLGYGEHEIGAFIADRLAEGAS